LLIVVQWAPKEKREKSQSYGSIRKEFTPGAYSEDATVLMKFIQTTNLCTKSDVGRKGRTLLGNRVTCEEQRQQIIDPAGDEDLLASKQVEGKHPKPRPKLKRNKQPARHGTYPIRTGGRGNRRESWSYRHPIESGGEFEKGGG